MLVSHCCYNLASLVAYKSTILLLGWQKVHSGFCIRWFLFGSLEVQKGFHWVKIKVLADSVPFRGSRGQLVSLPFRAMQSVAHDPFLHL